MLHARLRVDLPARPLPRSGRIARLLLSLVVDMGADEERDRLLGNSLEILRATLEAFTAASFDDVVAIRVGRDVIYADSEERVGDLQEGLQRVVDSGRLEPGFGSLRVVLSHHAEGLHTVAEVALDEEVARGAAPLRVELVGRIEGLRVRGDETLPAYRDRVRQALADGELDRQREHAARLAQALASALGRSLGSPAVHLDGPELRVVAPGPLQVARLRHLGFGKRLRGPSYRAESSSWKRSPAYDHPHVRHFFDPYHDLLCWIIVGALLEGRVVAERITVVDPDDVVLAVLEDGEALRADVALPVARDLVRFEDAAVVVDESIAAAGLDAAETGSPHTPGFGGEGYG